MLSTQLVGAEETSDVTDGSLENAVIGGMIRQSVAIDIYSTDLTASGVCDLLKSIERVKLTALLKSSFKPIIHYSHKT